VAAEVEEAVAEAEAVARGEVSKRKERGTAFFTKRMMTTVETIV
jgi:hypothetical protein